MRGEKQIMDWRIVYVESGDERAGKSLILALIYACGEGKGSFEEVKEVQEWIYLEGEVGVGQGKGLRELRKRVNVKLVRRR